MLRKLFILCACVTLTQATCLPWNYDVGAPGGPARWHQLYSTCSGLQQSPIDINGGEVTYDEDLHDIHFINYGRSRRFGWELSNTGHSVKVALVGDLCSRCVNINGGGLGGNFLVKQFHFHWGSNSSQGSEHLINGRAFPMELHVVHYNTKYSNISEAVKHPDGLAVVGFMFEIQANNNRKYRRIVRKLKKIKTEHSKIKLRRAALADFLPPTYKTSKWYRYSGSLTTPTCNEVVTWTIMVDTIKISEKQLEKFRTVLDCNHQSIGDNFRPVQALNSRVVTANF